MDKVSIVSSDFVAVKDTYHPSDFDNFLPWACMNMGIDVMPIITRVEQLAYSSSATGSRRGKIMKTPITPHSKNAPLLSIQTEASYIKKYVSSRLFTDVEIIKMNTVYNSYNQLVQIKFCKSKRIPTCLIKVLTLAIPFHTHLTAIHVDGVLKVDPTIDLCDIIINSNITELVLDNTMLKSDHIFTLTEKQMGLKHLSLARCTIDDDMVEELASNLKHPLPASKTLSILNISSNKITDIGAKYLGEMLRMNRQLTYLNVSGNMITDIGVESILGSLTVFAMTEDELRDKRARRIDFLKDIKNKLANEMEVKSIKKKVIKLVSTSKKPKTGELKTDTQRTDATGTTDDSTWLDTREAAYKDMLAQFEDPFKSENLVVTEGITYCLGNNSLSYLSLAYNNLTYFSIKLLLDVLRKQQELNRQPKGLINVCIEGNNLPLCTELNEINSVLEAELSNINSRKKAPAKSTAR